MLYRYVTLARALKLSIRDLIVLMGVADGRPFSTLADGAFGDIDPARTLRFVRLAEEVNRSGFTAPVLDYLFSPLEEAPAALAPGPEAEQGLSDLREALIGIAMENAAVDDATGGETRARLALRFEAPAVERIAALVGGGAQYTAPLAVSPGALPEGKVTYDPDRRLLTAAGWLTDGERDALRGRLRRRRVPGRAGSRAPAAPRPGRLHLGVGLGWLTAGDKLRTSVLELAVPADPELAPAAIAARFTAFLTALLPHLRAALSKALVKQTLSKALGLDPPLIALALEGATGTASLSATAMDDFLALAGDGLQATYFTNPELSGEGEPPVVDPTVRFRWEGSTASAPGGPASCWPTGRSSPRCTCAPVAAFA